MTAPKELVKLVERFCSNREEYRGASYNETKLRREFLDPMFKLLGWDVENSKGNSEIHKEVVHEDSIKVGDSVRAPDYSFRVGGRRMFFLEAKKPRVNIKGDPSPAFQLRRYAWSANLTISILSDFEEFAVYDCRIKPKVDDAASVGRVLYLKCEEFASRWDEICAIFSRDAVLGGGHAKYIGSVGTVSGSLKVDEDFLVQIERWREILAKNIANRNVNLSIEDLNFSVQATIDRIVFLRICEDRGIEPFGRLRNISLNEEIYRQLVALFKDADDRYNSGIFHFSTSGSRSNKADRVTPSLLVDDAPLKEIITALYPPESAYEFSVLPADILGQVYERFLGKIIRLTKGHHAKVEEKPEVKKAGGVYYTPTHVVEHIVKETLGRALQGKTIAQASKIRVVDPACGSGSFLISAYQYLLDWHLAEYCKGDKTKLKRGRDAKIYEASDGWRLSSSERKRVLINNIFGVDVDAQAVEVAKLSLLLKVLEGETGEALFSQLRLFKERALPSLEDNIKCGNSLVEPDLFVIHGEQLESYILKANPFDWRSEFKDIFQAGGFDVVIGNPPYVDSEWMASYLPVERTYCTKKYVSASGNWDIFCVFIERAVEVARSGAYIGMIVPNKLGSAAYAAETRKIFVDRAKLLSIRDYSNVPVFPVAVYPIVFTSKKESVSGSSTVRFEKMETSDVQGASVASSSDLSYQDFFGAPKQGWPIFHRTDGIKIVERMRNAHPELGKVATVVGAATVAEAYEISPLLEDSEDGRGLRFVNSGTIDRYFFRWGLQACRYLKSSYQFPRISSSKLKSVSAKRLTQATSPKIIVAGMTKALECAVDLNGEYVPGKSTSVVMFDGELRVLLAVLNSKVVNYFYETVFGGDKLSGGYLRVGPPQLSQIPVPLIGIDKGAKRKLCGELVTLVERLHRLYEEVSATSTEREATLLQRKIVAIEYQINQLVYALYDMSSEDIAQIERAV